MSAFQESYSPKTNSSSKSFSHKHKKHLGQNFLVDHHVRNKILEACNLKKEETVLEIGPGQGFLTEEISKHVKAVIAIETDHALIDHLRNKFADSNVTVIHSDILKYPFEQLPKELKIVSNLPYNVATPIIEKVFDHRAHFTSFYMTVQLEYGQRMVSLPNTKTYGSFSCFVQYHGKVKILFKIKDTAFYPKPNVQSCFLELILQPMHQLTPQEEKHLFTLIRQSFGQRRKTLLNSLSTTIEKKKLLPILQMLKIDEKCRAENLNLNEYIKLANLLKE